MRFAVVKHNMCGISGAIHRMRLKVNPCDHLLNQMPSEQDVPEKNSGLTFYLLLAFRLVSLNLFFCSIGNNYLYAHSFIYM